MSSLRKRGSIINSVAGLGVGENIYDMDPRLRGDDKKREGGERQKETTMRIATYIFILLIIFFGITFAALNSSSVSVNYYLGESTLPLSWLLVIAFSVGCLLGLLVGAYLLLKANMKNYRLRQRLSLAEKEIENLRAIPLQDNT